MDSFLELETLTLTMYVHPKTQFNSNVYFKSQGKDLFKEYFEVPIREDLTKQLDSMNNKHKMFCVYKYGYSYALKIGCFGPTLNAVRQLA